MKVFTAVAYIFAVFAFLTMGSLMIIVSLHILTMEDALLKVEALYENPWQTFQLGLAGFVFILMGLIFSKIFVKMTRPANEMNLYGKWGHVNVSMKTLEEMIRKELKKHQEIRKAEIKMDAAGGNRIRLEIGVVVWENESLPELIGSFQSELSERLHKFLGHQIELDIIINIVEIVGKSQKLEAVPSN